MNSYEKIGIIIFSSGNGGSVNPPVNNGTWIIGIIARLHCLPPGLPGSLQLEIPWTLSGVLEAKVESLTPRSTMVLHNKYVNSLI